MRIQAELQFLPNGPGLRGNEALLKKFAQTISTAKTAYVGVNTT
jgi:hypothetical protein